MSFLEYSGLELVVWCKKINPPLRRLEEKSQYLIRGFAVKDGISCSSGNALFLHTSPVLRTAGMGHTVLCAASEP